MNRFFIMQIFPILTLIGFIIVFTVNNACEKYEEYCEVTKKFIWWSIANILCGFFLMKIPYEKMKFAGFLLVIIQITLLVFGVIWFLEQWQEFESLKG